MFRMIETRDGEPLHLLIEGTVTRSDVEQAAECCDDFASENPGKIGLVMELRNFKGYTIPAFFADFKFAVTHLDTFYRIALVGDNKLEEVMAKITDCFVRYEVKYFDQTRIREALEWTRPRARV